MYELHDTTNKVIARVVLCEMTSAGMIIVSHLILTVIFVKDLIFVSFTAYQTGYTSKYIVRKQI